MTKHIGLAAFATLALASTSVHAQSSFDRSRNVSVAERPREGFEAVGARVGAFMFYPRLTLSTVYDDNIYAQPINETSDVSYTLRPSLELQSNWARHSLNLYGRGRVARYQDRSSENTEDLTVGASGTIDVRRDITVRLAGSYADLTEARTAETTPTSSVSPIEYDYTVLSAISTYELNRIRLRGGLQYNQSDYKNGVNGAGGVIDQQYRDRSNLVASLRADYALSPATAVYANVNVNQRRYRLTPPATPVNRDSEGYDVGAGVSFDVTNLARGEIQAGYVNQDYTNGSVNGGALSGQLSWFPTQLTTVTVSAGRSVEETSLPASRRGYLSTVGSVRVDHELLRNVLLSGYVNGSKDAYSEQDRDDRRITAGLEANYLINRSFGANLAYQHIDLDSNGAQRRSPFKDNKLTLALTAQF